MHRKVDRRTFLKVPGLRDSLLLGVWRYLVPIPRPVWQSQVRGDSDLGFMTEAHHQVRDFVVLELPRAGEPLSLEFIARELDLPPSQVAGILDDLERHMTFLFRNEQGAVAWAYPVTVDRTPHHITFSSGEQVYAA
jgi:hypothetical protein